MVKLYIDANLGETALATLTPLMRGTPHYDVMLLAAQSYAELEQPENALKYYQSARFLAKTDNEASIAFSGINRMQGWIAASRVSSVFPIPLTRTHKTNIERQLSSNQKNGITRQSPTMNEIACKGIVDGGRFSCKERIRLARQYLSSNQGLRAIMVLQPLLTQKAAFETRVLAAQAYAESNQPQSALAYYRLAYFVAQTPQECTIASFGMGKIQLWLGHYYRAKSLYQRILNKPINPHDIELATAGYIKSLAYAGRPILAYHTIPSTLVFTTPEMVVAAAQATLWAEQADLTKNILIKYQPIIKSIAPQSPLSRDLQDVQWQTALNTYPNIVSPSEYYSKDTEDFSVLRSMLDYRHYWSEQNQSFIGFEQSSYKQFSSTLNSEGVYFRQKWRPTRELTLNGQVEPTTNQLWNPFLGFASANYRPNDYIGTQLLAQREIIQTFPAFEHHLMGNQYAASLYLSPFPYVRVSGSISRLDISDSNVRSGYFVVASTVLSTSLGLNLSLQRRGYKDKFVSPDYFSPNGYSANTVILRFGRKIHTVWHYYIDGGIGNQNIDIIGNPTATSPTQQIGLGLNGPISKCVTLNAYYAYTRQVSAFLGSPDYRYQYGAISLNILI